MFEITKNFFYRMKSISTNNFFWNLGKVYLNILSLLICQFLLSRHYWQELLTKMGIPADSARTNAKTFVAESITKDSLTMIDWEVLKELGVTTMGHALAILKLAKEQPLISNSYTKAPAVKLPQLHSGMASQQF